MITFKPVIRNIRADGFAAVYIRVTKDRESDYIKTNYIAKKSQLSGTKIKDFSLISKISVIVEKFINRLNYEDTEFWTLREVINFLMQENSQISFTDFFDEYLKNLINEGRDAAINNYSTAINSLKKFAGKEKLFFSEITAKLINAWIESLKSTNRAKNLYPIIINAVFKAGMLKYNDYERGILRIKNQPFVYVKIPKSEVPEKRAIPVDDIRKIFAFDTSKYKKQKLLELAKDIAMLIFCFVGINTKDLYLLQTYNFVDGKFCYNRAKTKKSRTDKAYIEITVPEMILPLIKKYKGKNGNLFCFSEKYNNPHIFSTRINEYLKIICKGLNIENVTCYSFRHSWATIAQNNCGASTAMVAFALNHATEYRITRGYIKTDFTPIDKLNKQVLDFVFGE